MQPGPRLPGKIAIISGGASGIGAACALRLAARGVHVFAGVRNDADGAALHAQNATLIIAEHPRGGLPIHTELSALF